MYLGVGQEHIAATLSELLYGWMVFPQHRSHSYNLSFGISAKSMVKELLGRKDGCDRGMGGSSSMSSKKHKIYGHSGLLGDQIPIATGAAHASNNKTLCVTGDASVEECYALSSFGYAATKQVPILYVCEDNDLSILTPKNVRRSWHVVDVAHSFGLDSYDIEDDIVSIYKTVKKITLPGLININTCRHLWHAGSGCDGPPKYNRFEQIKEEFSNQIDINVVENEAKKEMSELWQRLPKQ